MSHPPRLSRREMIELGLATGFAATLPAITNAGEPNASGSGHGRQPRNIIFMVSDGMSPGVVSMAEPFARLVRQQETHWGRLMRTPGVSHGLFDTSSLSSLVTDSAAASTAWASGSRVFNGAINVLPDGREMTPIGRLARAQGRRFGLVTTTRITHATPAGFAAVVPVRDQEDAIAEQYLGGVDVLLGGGCKHFDATKRKDGHDLIAEFQAQGYTFWDTRAQVCGTAAPNQVLGLFYPDHLPFTIDHRNDPDLARQVPTLAEMTRAALPILASGANGFLLQVEGGRVDHAAHANDAAAILWDQLAFDDAVGVALEFAQGRDDTLVVVTTDHGNANPGLNGSGSRYGKTNDCFERLARATVSYERLRGVLPNAKKGDAPPREALAAGLERAFGLELRDSDVKTIQAALAGDLPSELNNQHHNLVGVLGQILGNHNGVGWTGVSHTQDLAITTATGPGAEAYAGLHRNTDVYDAITAAIGSTHRNPAMTADRAQPLLAQIPETATPHWV
jgi:alkaline phosphatase